MVPEGDPRWIALFFFRANPAVYKSFWIPLALAFGVLGAARTLGEQPGGRALAFALLAGAVLGFVLQRSRFCFFCHSRDFFEQGDPRGLLAIMLALVVGTVGYHIILAGWLPVPVPGRLPPDAHIGPVSWALVLAGAAFGLGMVISGSCISAHWYRLGEGSPVAPFALLGAGGGFILGFLSWNSLYTATIATAPVWWLPHWFGYGGSLLVQLGLLALLAAGLWRAWPRAETAPPPARFSEALRGLFVGRWPYWTGGLAVGLIGAFLILRLKPLGVTAALGAAARAIATQQGWIPNRLEGLDGFGGCATIPQDSWLNPSVLLIAGLVAGSLGAALASRQFEPRWPTGVEIGRGLLGGLLLGWGAMTGLGCTIGTLLSGTMAGAVSGWVFGISLFLTLWLGLKLQAWLQPATPPDPLYRNR
jgi:hypothetical protein